MALDIEFESASIYSLAFQQNHYPLITLLALSNSSDDEPLNDMLITLTCDPEFFEPAEWRLDYLAPGERIELQLQSVKVSVKGLQELTSDIVTNLRLQAIAGGKVLAERHFETTFMPKNYWAGQLNMPELLAAFSMPDSPYVESMVVKASNILKDSNLSHSMDGYQSRKRENPYAAANALWAVVQGEQISYINPAPSFATTGQRIRTSEDIQSNKSAACLDLSMLFASLLERVGLNAMVALTRTHAFVGVWLVDDCFPMLTMDDPQTIRKRVALKDLVMFETTLACAGNNVSFSQAAAQADQLLGENNEENFVYAIDIAQARKQQIKPLPILIKQSSIAGEDGNGLPVSPMTIAPPPPLPPIGEDSKFQEELTPETRVDQWQRKLLDLTKRNRLLNLSSHAVSLNLYCPELAQLEDMLAAGDTFQFSASDDTPLKKDGNKANQDIYRFHTGNTLQIDYASGQLNKKILIANDSKKNLESRLLTLYRNAKTALEEGGSNTLFLAIGMLRWKENEQLTKSYRAPLILLPVQLIRSSARSAIRIRQIPDEEPIFNTTLIEFLSQDYEIDLGQFRNELPKDDSGIDVSRIWSVVRQKVKDEPGFEVVEDLVLSTFSFAKYLMWRDLKDRLDDLKSNLFVEHLIERPSEIYQQDSYFVDKKEVDSRIKPSEIYTPLNADSSQIVAIEASGHAQDFVMEGPPGTGKSETIANIICHNLALGRRVLFVAEKMAALNVVYKRLTRVGVSSLCLELHSNKANKASVLEQLRKSWQGRNTSSQSDWEKKAQDLFNLRGDLNRYVEELYKPSVLGIKPRKAISRSVRLANHHPIKLDWPGQISQSPIKDEHGYTLLLDAARDLGLAYKDLDGLDTNALGLINKYDWSNAWQAEVIACARSVNAELRATKTAANLLIAQIGLDTSQSLSMRGLHEVCALGEFIGELKYRPLGLALSGKVRDHLENIQRLIDEKRKIDNLLDESEAGLSIDDILKLPTTEWAVKLVTSKVRFWPLSALTRMSLRSAMKKSGVTSYRNIEVADTLDQIRQQCSELVGLADTFVVDKIWLGWETRPADLESSKLLVSKRSNSLRSLIHELGIEPVKGLTHLQTKLGTEWEFLDANIDLLNKAQTAVECWKKLDQALDSFRALAESEVSPESSVDDITMKMDALVSGERVLNAWCNWLSAKRVSSQYGLDALAVGLESGLIKYNDAQEAAKTAVHAWVAPILIDSSEVLRRFSASSHEALIEDFCKLDEEVARTTAEYIVAKTSASVPDPGSSNTPIAYGVLSTELLKKSKHKPIRQLIEEMGETILNLTPCMMMSPLSVAQYLPASFNAFDLVVFDEASQITVYDAVGAIARGKNSIIVGDPHQMPPTNFFNRTDDDATDDFEDLESILDQALAAKMPLHRLTGHYRSRHESLIAFSNNRYYENELVTYPAADTKASAVYFHKINGQYSKGSGRNNVIEARAVADEIVRRLTDPILQKLSIGVVALNSEQQRTIEDELDTKRRANSEIEPFFNGSKGIDPVFVKNLESVQGDERDVIFLSLGYGPTEPGAKSMSMNFGPLNKSGGERRLNVAITRATTEVHIFSSFTPDMIDLSRTQAKAVNHLKGYLEFAEKGPEALARIASAEHGIDQFDSDFEQAVAYQLREKGWKVQTQVGVGKFRIDMGIIHPDYPGRYLAGIECDGATYHQSPAARDRDRVRQIILEKNLGWTIVRLWSTDYFINPEHAVDKIDQRLKQLLEASTHDAKMDTHDSTEAPIGAETPVVELPSNLDKSRFFDDNYQPIVLAVVREILAERNGISLTELVSEVSRRFGLSRSSSLQQEHVYNLILPWAGVSDYPEDDPTVWLSQDDITDFIKWRGIAPWGVPRKWQSICYHEQLGAIQAALKKFYRDPVSALKGMFNLSRLNTATREEFERWVKQYMEYIKRQPN